MILAGTYTIYTNNCCLRSFEYLDIETEHEKPNINLMSLYVHTTNYIVQKQINPARCSSLSACWPACTAQVRSQLAGFLNCELHVCLAGSALVSTVSTDCHLS